MEELSASYSLRLCEVCGDQDGQYKCPRCSVLSCSLVCCKKHKASTGCSGRRDKTAFVPMQQFNGANLRSDFHFLEDVLRCKNQAKRVLGAEESNRPARKKPSAKGRAPSAGLSVVSAQNLDNHLPHTRKLVAEAHSLHINLVVMPEGMSRRKTNTSRWNPQRKGIDWRVHLVFIIRPMHAVAPILQRDYLALGPVSVIGDELVSCFCEEVADSTTLRDLIANTMAPSAGNSVLRNTVKELSKHRDSLRCYLQKLPSSSNSPCFYEIDQDMTLTQILQGKTVYEFPMFIVSFAENVQFLKVLLSEEEETTEPSTISFDSIQEGLREDKNAMEVSGDASAGLEESEDEEAKVGDDAEEESFLALLKKYETEDIEKLRRIVAEGAMEELQ